jgi:3'(2'), 5'-bisphosphate nucleotidase
MGQHYLIRRCKNRKKIKLLHLTGQIVADIPEMITNSSILQILSLLEKAGSEIMTVYREGNFKTRLKEDDSPVTSADLLSDKLIKSGLAVITPGVKVFSEETKDISFSERSLWNPLWILDPLDGTKEFIARNDEFCISLAMIEGNNPVAGFIFAPVFKTSWYAIKGEGAFRVMNGVKTKLPVVRGTGSYCINISRSHHSGKEAAWIKNFSRENEIVIETCGSAIKFCKIAEGVSDIYPKFSLIHEWDIAAGHLIIEESGGSIIETATGVAPVYNKEDYHQPPFVAFGGRIDSELISLSW